MRANALLALATMAALSATGCSSSERSGEGSPLVTTDIAAAPADLGAYADTSVAPSVDLVATPGDARAPAADFAATTDLSATIDAAQPPDLAAKPDLAVAADLASPADLAKPDLSTSPDLAGGPCTLAPHAGCANGMGCYVVDGMGGTGCLPQGPGTDGDDCTAHGPSDCAGGYFCVEELPRDNCRKACRAGNNLDCPAGKICHPIQNWAYGFCG